MTKEAHLIDPLNAELARFKPHLEVCKLLDEETAVKVVAWLLSEDAVQKAIGSLKPRIMIPTKQSPNPLIEFPIEIPSVNSTWWKGLLDWVVEDNSAS